MLSRVAVAIVHRYPQPWRERYGDEVLELLRESPARLSDVSELFRGLIVERVRALIEDSDRPHRTMAILGWTQPLFVVLFVASAVGLGAALRGVQQAPEGLGVIVMVTWQLGFLPPMFIRRIRQLKGKFPPGPVLSAKSGLLLMPVVFGVIATIEWCYAPGHASEVFSPGTDYWIAVIRNVSYQGFAVAVLSFSFWPRRRLLQALMALAQLETATASAQRWVDGCHEMMGRGFPVPLDEAQSNLDHWLTKRDQAREQLNALGYRARFERSL
jgi:hypothetical protein